MFDIVFTRAPALVAGRIRKADAVLDREEREATVASGNHVLRVWQHRLVGSGSDDTLHSRTGNTRRQLRVSPPKKDGISWSIRVGAAGTSGKILRAHEEGATIRPKNRKFLTIPLGPAKTGAGVARGPARSFPDTFFLRFGGKLFLMRQKTKGRGKGSLEALFVLVTRVKLPKRRTAYRTSKDAAPKIRELYGRAVALAVRAANGD